MGEIWNTLHGMKSAMLMVVVQIGFAGVNVFYKLAALDGMSLRIIVAYRFFFASAFIAPLAFFLERKSRPKLTWIVVFEAFLCGMFGGTLAQNLYLESLALTSATFAAAMSNLVPAITFVMAVAFRLERLNIGKLTGKAKVVGTLIGIGGAMLLTFYKGVEIHIWSTKVDLLHHSHQLISHVAKPHTETNNRVWGGVLAVGSCLSYAFWLIVQTKMSGRYPCHYSSTAMMSMMGAIQSSVFALCVEKDWSQWKLGWNIRLLTVAYSGIVASGVMVTLISWCVHMRGPLYVSIFSPLMLVLVAIAGSLLLDELLYLGCILGGIMIVCGLYMVLWGKGKEMKKIRKLAPSESTEEAGAEMIDIVIPSPVLNNTKTNIPNRIDTNANNTEDEDHHNSRQRSSDNISVATNNGQQLVDILENQERD